MAGYERHDARWRQNARPAGGHVSWGAMLGGPAMTPLRILAAAAFLWLWAAAASAQDINPDRPDLTTSAEVVPAGALQIETGLEYERARVGGGPTERQLSVQATLRLGLTPAVEISLEGVPFVWLDPPRTIAFAVGAIVLASVIGAMGVLYPAWRASRRDAYDLVRSEG